MVMNVANRWTSNNWHPLTGEKEKADVFLEPKDNQAAAAVIDLIPKYSLPLGVYIVRYFGRLWGTIFSSRQQDGASITSALIR